jgi:hypothetical protein
MESQPLACGAVADEVPAAKFELQKLAEDSAAAQAAGEAPTEYVRQASLHLLSNNLGARLEIEFPDNVELDERNPLHILAWYFAHGATELMPIAIQSWHLSRRAMLAQDQLAENQALVHQPKVGLVGVGGKPL